MVLYMFYFVFSHQKKETFSVEYCFEHLCERFTRWSSPFAIFGEFWVENDGVQSTDQFSSFAHSCLTLCDPMNCSMPGLSVHHYLPECSDLCPLIQWYHPTISSSVAPFSFCPQFLPASGLFQWVSFLHQVAKILELQLQHQSFRWIFRIDFFSIDWFDLFASFF